MEKKSLISLVVIAALSLLWVFNFLGRDNVSDDFTQQASLQINSEECQKSTSKSCSETLLSLKPGFAIHQHTQTSYVLRPDQPGADGLERVRLTIEQPTSPLPAATSCEQKKIDQFQSTEKPQFSIESLQVQPSRDLPDGYEFFYQRLQGNWEDFQARSQESAVNRNRFIEAVMEIQTATSSSEASI